MQKDAALILDMGAGNELSDGEGGDLIFYEYGNGPGILLDRVAIAVAADDGMGNPGPFITVFVWGDGDRTNNGSLPPGFAEEREEEPIAANLLINGTGIGIDIGHNDGRLYRFVRLTTYPETWAPGRHKAVEVDAIERARIAMPQYGGDYLPVPATTTPTAATEPTASPSATPTRTTEVSPTPEPSATP